MNASPALSTTTRSAIVLIALLQGLMLYIVQEADHAWPFNEMGNRLRWYAWVLSVPTAVALTLVELRDRRLWLHAALASLLVLGLASWIGWNVGTADQHLSNDGLLVPFTISMAIAVFVSLPWWQYRLQMGHWHAPYAALFERAWQNGLTLALAMAFTGLTWLLLWLWAQLFVLVEIRFFRELFREDAFIALATGSLFGFGVLIGRTQHRAIQMVRSVLFAVGRGLLPLLALIAVTFVLSLPFTGLEPLWRTRSAASLLLTLSLLLVVFVNAVYQHDSATPPYPAWLRRFVEASLLALPVYAALAVYAMALRIGQYGWTLDRFWGLLVALVVAGYGLGYALAVVRPRETWLQRIEPVNRWMCWTVLALALLANSPVLDPIRISVASQVARLQANAAAIELDEVQTLRFSLGRRGVQALEALPDDPAFSHDARARAVIATMLARTSRSGWEQEGRRENRITDPQVLQQHIKLARDTPAPDPDWWRAVLASQVAVGNCLKLDTRCVALRRDLDADGADEMLLCELLDYMGPQCRVHARQGTQWADVGQLDFPASGQASAKRANQALQEGHVDIHPPRWGRVSLEGGPQQSLDEPASKEPRP
ncbi:DUF4153 domain-containing protein [Stenotrophomonas sp.]|uniref:DUF4153 domain-containing protein n=1 Tax=Stenotrophomonas sp. TaxID=69392 RepID=UPI002FCBE9CF